MTCPITRNKCMRDECGVWDNSRMCCGLINCPYVKDVFAYPQPDIPYGTWIYNDTGQSPKVAESTTVSA